METCVLPSPIGWIQLVGDEYGLISVKVLDEDPIRGQKIPEVLSEAATQIKSYFNKELYQFDLLLNPEGTDFEKKVWSVLQTIPYGKTMSYLDVSKLLGNPKAIRAVARANGKNPLWIIIPCHRVVGSDGSLTGYAGGLYRKEWLLTHEGAIQQQSLF
jgi:methylated-DNA-[protein]-cysteine S-methyltransferase